MMAGMRLVSVQVQLFRNVVDSGRIAIQEDVTCFVGKNESGKTALLAALHRLNPANPATPFSAQDDYPRWRLSRDKKAGTVDESRPIEATFDLDPDDVEAVETAFWPGAVTGRTFKISLNYLSHGLRTVSVDDDAALASVFDELGTPQAVREQLAASGEMHEALKTCQSIVGKPEAHDADVVKHAEWFVAETEEKLGKWSLLHGVANLLQKRMPRFFYFSEYQTLPGRINLEEVAKEEEEPGTSPLQTARALLQLAGTDLGAIKEEDFDARKSELEAASNELTQQVFEYWTQNPNLSVEIDTDKQTVDRGHQGQTAVVKYLDVRVKDSRHGFTGNFEQRSTGFQWFFSFFAAFSEFEDLGHDVIVLLDEPAMSLHGRAQADFLRFINERLAAGSQVLYTTHSPFMVEADKLERVRIVEDRGPKVGAVVTEDVHSVGDDATFPLQAALGYDIAQNLFVGPDNLLIEGSSDYTYLRVMSSHLTSLGREGLDDRWRVVSTHGATNMPAFVSLFDDLDVTLLIDGTSKSLGKLQHLVKVKALPAKRVITTDQFAGTSPSDIEDLFTAGEYLKLYNPAFSSTLKASELTGSDRVIARIGRAEGADFNEHGRPAEHLLRMPDRDKFLNSLSGTTLDKWEALFRAVNATLS